MPKEPTERAPAQDDADEFSPWAFAVIAVAVLAMIALVTFGAHGP